MPIRFALRASGVPAFVAVATLAVAGCGAGPGKPAAELATPEPASASASPSAVASASRPLTAEQLVAAALPQESPDGDWHPVSLRKPQVGDREDQVSDPACGQLLAAAHARRPSQPAPAVVDQTFNWKDDNGGA
ncbi:hypothetical protein OHA12_37100, partial [Streptomyces virginiae]|nr:hypothetical protein [Streptomyces virginiae]